ncbi:polymorphic toxin type 44 domain-containing protein [Nocardia sp. NPDC006044]|uniref:polymorphic toxin type 44 domain-containing protein n=1 Tax=Nocardia sp. NPDC006044 TaxID=3364306 RepID=UPI0036A5D0B6
MTLTRSQLDSYDPVPLWDIAAGLKGLGLRIEGLFERYVTHVSVPGWQGVAAEAAHNRAVADRKTAYLLVDSLDKAAGRLDQGYWDISTLLSKVRGLITSAEAAGFPVRDTGMPIPLGPPVAGSLAVHYPPGSEQTAELESARAEWERQILSAASAVEAEDKRVQQDLTSVSAALKVEFEAVGGSQTSQNEQRYVRAEDFIFDEMKRNIDSNPVKWIHGMLHPIDGKQSFGLWAEGLNAWRVQVKTNGPWDHKPQLKQLLDLKGEGMEPDFFFQQPGTKRQVNYDIYSNLHYGYVGRAAGIEGSTLLWGAARGGEAGQNDQGDEITVQAGIDLYEKYGPGMTREQFHHAVEETVDKLETAQNQGKNVPQIRHD